MRNVARLGLLLLATACGDREESAPSAPAKAPEDLLAAVNAFRKERGLAPLARDAALERAARAHAEEMARLGYFGHYSPVPGNRTPDDRVARAGWPDGLRYHELLALADTRQSALGAWTAKPADESAVTDAACAVAGWGRRGRYWVLLLGSGVP